MNPSFPLLHLPRNVLINVINKMETRPLFGLSLVSTKCKNHVKSLNLRANLFSVRISRDIRIELAIEGRKSIFCNFYKELGRFQENEEPRRLEKPSFILFTFGGRQQWKNEDYEFKEYIDHLKDVFHFKETSLTFDDDAQRFDLDSVYETFKNTTWLELLSNQSLLFNNQVLKRFAPLKELWVGDGVFGNQKIPDILFIQDYDTLLVHTHNVQVTLNELLSVNSKECFLYGVRPSNEMLNKFIKCWMKNGRTGQLIQLLAARSFASIVYCFDHLHISFLLSYKRSELVFIRFICSFIILSMLLNRLFENINVNRQSVFFIDFYVLSNPQNHVFMFLPRIHITI